MNINDLKDELRARLQPDFDKGKELVDSLTDGAAKLPTNSRSHAVDAIAAVIMHQIATKGPCFAFATAFAEAIMRLAEAKRAQNDIVVKE